MKPKYPFLGVPAVICFSACLTAVCGTQAASDWPQWRGPDRNGILKESPPLPDRWPEKGLTKLWDSEPIPSDEDGGHGSVIVAAGRVYSSIVWHTDVETETRAIDYLVMTKLGYQSVAGWPKETVEKLEKDKLELSPDIWGGKLDAFVKDWCEKNLDKKKRQTCSGYVRSRFEKRADAIPLEVYDRLLTVQKTRFPNEAAMIKWVDDQHFSEKVRKEILDAVPPTMKVAEDVVICIDLQTGKTLWKFKSPGDATGRMASSTPCIADGRIYALGSLNFYAINAADGKLLWSVKLPGKGPASSPMVVDGILVMNVGKLAAYDAVTGRELWQQPKVGGGNSSPVAWKTGDKTIIICNGRGILAGVDLKSGNLLWSTPGGGDATPAVVGDFLATQTSKPDVGIMAGWLTPSSFTKLWSIPYDPLRSQSSPLIIDNCVYLMDDNLQFCFDLNTGRELWKQESGSTSISSPVFADGKIFLVSGGGSRVMMFKPSPEKCEQLGKASIKALWVPSPAIAEGKLVVRGRKNITCYDLTGRITAVSAEKKP